MQRGELWWTKLPIRGATTKRRPMLVVSADAALYHAKRRGRNAVGIAAQEGSPRVTLYRPG